MAVKGITAARSDARERCELDHEVPLRSGARREVRDDLPRRRVHDRDLVRAGERHEGPSAVRGEREPVGLGIEGDPSDLGVGGARDLVDRHGRSARGPDLSLVRSDREPVASLEAGASDPSELRVHEEPAERGAMLDGRDNFAASHVGHLETV
jgi:hypothetical protein